nr:SPOR domain-containing protein [Aliidiomarina indica]
MDIRDAQFPDDFNDRVTRTEPTYEGDIIDAPELREAQIGANSVEPAQPADESPTETPATAALTGDAYTIQLGAFRNAASVQDLVRSLRAEGFQAYARTQPSSSGEPLTLLMVGPELSEQRLREQLPKLKELTGLDGTIRSYQPVP